MEMFFVQIIQSAAEKCAAARILDTDMRNATSGSG